MTTQAVADVMSKSGDGGDGFDNFTNDSSKMVAWERHLESSRDDALFTDPFAKILAGSNGEQLSDVFGKSCAFFKADGWCEFHKAWAATRTRFIDDAIMNAISINCKIKQVVNLGAGQDTRPYRLEFYKAFTSGNFDVDMEVVNRGKKKIFEEVLKAPTSFCPTTDVDLDFLDKEKTIKSQFALTNFDSTKPCVIISEGLISYLAHGKVKFLKDASDIAAAGSVFILNFMDLNDNAAAQAVPSSMDTSLSQKEVSDELSKHGWCDFRFYQFGDDGCNFGRFPIDRFKPLPAFSFCVATKK